MVTHTETIRREVAMNCLRVSDHFVGLALKGLKHFVPIQASLQYLKEIL